MCTEYLLNIYWKVTEKVLKTYIKCTEKYWRYETCAEKVKSEEYGIGYCIPEMHTMLEDGTVTHNDVEFEDCIVENYPVSELKILKEAMHEHYDNEEKNQLIEPK